MIQDAGIPKVARVDGSGKLTRTYRKWSSMWQRCTNPGHLAYLYYGGQGVTVSYRWRSYDAFVQDMGECPPGLWLDRISNAIGYEPGNCRWVTPKESAANRGPKATDPNSIRQKAKRAGLPYTVVYQRMRWGWAEDRALTTPVAKRGGAMGAQHAGVRKRRMRRIDAKD